MTNEFPPNSRTQRPEREERPERTERKDVSRVTKGRVILRKKPLHKRFIDAFRPEDNKGFAEYILIDVLVPGIKDTLADSATAAIDNALGVSGTRSRRRSRGEYTSYNRMSAARPRDRRDRDDDRPRRRESRMADDVREVVLDSRVEAEEIIDNLFELASKYDAATMRDLLSMIGEPHDQTHEDWGWRDLRGARVHRVREGYLIDLPRPVPLD